MTPPDPDDSAPHLSAPAAGGAAAPAVAAGPADVDRYQDLGLLGAGGMGEVRAVFDARLGRQVARKAPRTDVPGAAGVLAREAAVTASLEHPGIVPVYDAGLGADGRPWYTMRLVRGRSLRQVIADTPNFSDRLALLRPLLAAVEAVAYAHARGVVHCDLKTTNLMLGEHGEVQVVDWGLATSAASAPGGGTPVTMAPEQQRGEPAGPASDVWAIGIILMELLTGKRPVAPLTEAQTDALPIEGSPVALRALLLHCLKQDPTQRYPNASAVAADLARYLDGRPVQAHDYSLWDHLRRLVAQHRLAAGVLLVALVVVGGVSATATQRVIEGRDQARAAERVAQEARARSDATLNRALIFEARTAAAQQRRPEAEVLAAHALALSESVEARGVLAAFGATARPRGQAEPVPHCPGSRRVGPAGDLCLERRSLTAHLSNGVRWTADIEAADAAFAGDEVIVTQTGNRGLRLDAQTGAPLGETPELPSSYGLRSGLRAAWLVAGRTVLRFQGGATEVFTPCGDQPVGAVAEGAAGQAFLSCGPQGLHRWQPGAGGPTALPLSLWDPLASIQQLAAGPQGAVAVGTSRGQVIVVNEAGALFQAELPTAITSLTWTRDGRRLLVTQRIGAPVILDGASGADLGRLPADAGQVVAASGDSALVLDGRGGMRWQLAQLSPLVLGAGAGITGVVPGLRGDVVVTRGDGSVEAIDLATGESRRRPGPSARPLKGITRLPDGSGYAVVGVEGGLRILSADLQTERLRAQVAGRRILPLGGDLLVLRYSGQGALYDALAPDGTEPRPAAATVTPWYDAGGDSTGAWAAALSDEDQLWLLGPQGATAMGRFPDASAVDARSDGGAIIGESEALVQVGPDGSLTRLPCADGPPMDLALSPDDRWVALGGRDGVVRIFDLQRGVVSAVLEGHKEQVSTLAWVSPTRLLSGSWDGTVRQWDLSGMDRSADAWLTILDEAWGLELGEVLAAARP